MTIQTQGRLYCTAVATAWGIIMKPPSPQTLMQVVSGRASLAPRTPTTPKPMAANPPAVKWVLGTSVVQYCSTQGWLLPTSENIMASLGATLRMSVIRRRGSMGSASL